MGLTAGQSLCSPFIPKKIFASIYVKIARSALEQLYLVMKPAQPGFNLQNYG
jgi:hypothetical protein